MKVGISQSSYIPWRGYFDLIRSVDLFVIFDDVAFGSKGSWRHRNQLKFGDKLKWLTIPVRSKSDMSIDRVVIDQEDPGWRSRHEQLISAALSKAPFYYDALNLWKKCVGEPVERLSDLNRLLINDTCRYLGIQTPVVDARQYGAQGRKTDRLIDLIKKIGADAYLSGPTARTYLNESLFRAANVRLEYKTYDYQKYPQCSGPYIETVSILDTIANLGPQAAMQIKSMTPNLVAVG